MKIEKFTWEWKHPFDKLNTEVVLNHIYGESNTNICYRDKNGKWTGYLAFEIEKEFEKAYKKYQISKREEKLKRILNGT